ncbi:MAG: hypothetical protein AVDCRST_MAG89-2656, partial [uncultured Gemmatimonadetes bacterium]
VPQRAGEPLSFTARHGSAQGRCGEALRSGSLGGAATRSHREAAFSVAPCLCV